jgi:hypothetical protein
MKRYGLDLSSYTDVKEKSQHVLAAVVGGKIPCDGAWPADRVALFKKWMGDGMAPSDVRDCRA